MDADLRAQHRLAVEQAGEFVRRVQPGHLARPTPCGDWTLADLLAHMVGQHFGFGAAARHGDAPVEAYAPRPFDLAVWDESVADLLAAFAAADPAGQAVLREIAPAALPMAFVFSAQLLDTVVHTWDVAQSLGEPYEPSAELAETVAAIARAVPDDARRTRPNAAFAPALASTGSAWERTLAQLGRQP